jgi:SpoVK/Ycf46/Vps4 family AAA+-type ATPase
MDLAPYIKACYSILYVLTPEETRAELMILKTAQEMKRRIKLWSHTDGFKTPGTGKDAGKMVSIGDAKDVDPVIALLQLRDSPKTDKISDIIVMRDLHMFLGSPAQPNAKPVRLLRDISTLFKKSGDTLIIISPIKKIPAELERDITVIELELPNREEIQTIFASLYTPQAKKFIGEITPDEQERTIQAAMGLTFGEADNAFAKAFVEYGGFDKEKKALEPVSKLVLREKAIAVKKSGILEYFEPKQTANDVGGLENLKTWLKMRSKAFSKKAREFGLPLPKGILLAGLPGCGKSLSAKAASHILGLPLLRFDIGRVFSGLVGDSERNMRTAISTAEAVGSCVLWIDEMEKAFAGMSGSNSGDGGTSQRVFGNFITWMQEKTTPCFIIATVNRIESLPPELLRKGRFDETFFVGLPSKREREQILKVHLRLKNQKIDDAALPKCVEASDGFSGAELEEAIVTGMYNAFDQDRSLTADDLIEAIKLTNPLSKSKSDDLKAMAKWASTNAVNASKIEETAATTEFASTGRQLQF